MRRPTTAWALGALLLACVLAAPLTAAAQGAYGPGACLSETTRTCTATDAPGIADLDALGDTVGTDGAAGPTRVQSVGGTQATGEIEELRVDATGHLQVDVVTGPPITGSVTVQGVDANDATITGDPVLGGFAAQALGAVPTVSDAGDMVQAAATFSGIQMTTITTGDGGDSAVGDLGVAPPTVGVQVIGSDGAAARALLVDSAGRLQAELPEVTFADGGVAPAGFGVAALGTSGAQTHILLTDTAGRLQIDMALLDGIAPNLNVGAPGTGTLRVVQAQADGTASNSVLTAADQSEVAPDIAINANRSSITVMSSGTTTCLVAIGSATAGTKGLILCGGTADDDGTGCRFTETTTESIYIYDLSGAGTCKYRYIERQW